MTNLEQRPGATTPTFPVAILLFGSGLSALVYQTVWLREFRLVFGASTSATAAVLAIFMGGLGAGGFWLGKRADLAARPLRFYGAVELVAATSAALTPFLILVADRLYILTGGTASIGVAGASIVRIVLAAIVLAIPTLAMGASLPAATRSVESEDDVSRSRLGMLYGSNTIGAVAGALLPTFWLLEAFGNRSTLWLACGFNLAVGVTALLVDHFMSKPVDDGAPTSESAPVADEGSNAAAGTPVWFVLAAAMATGFVFFLMEVVWYRLLTPLLGGTTFTFGLILAVALLGIGMGGALYATRSPTRSASINTFAVSCLVEALLLAIPFALGDRIALVALQLRPLGSLGFEGHILGWSIVTGIVVLPAAVVAGIQFPILISLLGSGRRGVAADVGKAYAANTTGAILGALAGGFGLLPILSAPGAWIFSVALLLIFGSFAMVVWVRRVGPTWSLVFPASVGLAALAILLFSNGPTAFWRHSPIGAGRADLREPTYNTLKNFVRLQRRIVEWDEDGIESSIALTANQALAFVVNGKIDGNARFDSGTQIMSALVGGILHPNPKKVLIVGLGTGSSAGWIGTDPAIERVDVVELEPATLEVAKACSAVNLNVLDNEKVHIQFGDAREVLRVSSELYDIIFSEPSNPYRAGVASLYTVDYYEAAEKRLSRDGVFIQFLQAYEVDAKTIRSVYASIGSVFPVVETWQTQVDDLILIGRRQPNPYSVEQVRERIAREPYKSALASVWFTDDPEGFFAHYLAGDRTARLVAEGAEENTDDRTIIEFSFARTVGQDTGFNTGQLRGLARFGNDARPELDGELDWRRLARRQFSMSTIFGGSPYADPYMDEQLLIRARAHEAFIQGNYEAVLGAWGELNEGPDDDVELITISEALANLGDGRAVGFIDAIRLNRPVDAMVTTARFLRRKGRVVEAGEALASAYELMRTDAWFLPSLVDRSFVLALEIAREDATRAAGRRLVAAMGEPFVVKAVEERRIATRFSIAAIVDGSEICTPFGMETIEAFEPHVPWDGEFLTRREQCYRQLRHPLADEAAADLEAFMARDHVSLTSVVRPR